MVKIKQHSTCSSVLGQSTVYLGRKYKISKYCIHIISWTHNNDDTQHQLPTMKNHTILVTDSKDHNTYKASLLQNNEPFNYLRITFTTNGNQNHQLKPMVSTTQEGSRILSISPFKNYHSKLYQFTNINPKIHYSFSYTSLSPK